ncbi:tetratricopeptide repeat protein [Pyxidicoccus xibeiensis]|uniref:hypothetical protein n=1 Tax=Pyxidicoccus xibeiensis TaxID=2906759 RepID=UPI0020A7C4AB|nr:hypothetical protein [Pyxidicoccus xibeiensis]MCP3137039.1 hypothetical protein [Pyxidicoccus xibeiensis]
MLEQGERMTMQDHAARVLETLDQQGCFWVAGTPGAGRWELAQRIRQQRPKTHVIQLPSMDEADCALHGLLQAAAVLGQDALVEAASDSKPLQSRARKVAEALSREGWTLVVYLPGSWTFSARVKDPAGLIHQRRGLELLSGWAAAQDLNWVLLTAPLRHLAVPSFLAALPSSARLILPPRRVAKDVLEDSEAWGSSAEAASILRRAMDMPLDVTALQLRLMVALVHMGDDPEVLLQQVASSRNYHAPAALDVLEPRLEEVLRRPDNEAFRKGLHRLLLSRFPLPLEEVRRLSMFSDPDLSLLSRCIGSGAENVRIDERVRRLLLRSTEDRENPAEPDAHFELASFHRQRDGALAVEQAQGEQVLHWLEKVHHLGHAGARGANEWASLRLTAREFFWDRARALSIEQRDYLGAAAVYQQCIEQVDAEDVYSWHYLGFNLDRAAQQRQRAEEAFREAIRLDPANPWWNGRLVTFLIGQSRFRAAEQEWRALQERVDPDGTQVRQGPSLALNLHRWVVDSWLERGEVERARMVFNAIPMDVVGQHDKLQELRQKLEDAEEVRQLGEPVYPASVPVELRWKKARFLERVNGHGSPLKEWFPGRVVKATSQVVSVVVVTPETVPQSRQVVVKEVSREQWRRATGSKDLPRTDTFIEVGSYEDGSLSIVLVPSDETLLQPPQLMGRQALRYLKRWA